MAIDPSGIEQYNQALRPDKYAHTTLINPQTAASGTTPHNNTEQYIKKYPLVRKKNKVAASSIMHTVNEICDNDIVVFRNSAFDNTALELLTSGHRKSFEFLEEIVLVDRERYGGELRSGWKN